MLFFFIVKIGFSQKKTRKQLREGEKIEKIKQTAALVDAKDFVLVAQKAFPQGFIAIDLSTNPNFIEFKPDFIKSEMPFYGRGYGGIGYEGDTGLNFEGKPITFTVEKAKKTYEIRATIRSRTDVFKIIISIIMEGSAT